MHTLQTSTRRAASTLALVCTLALACTHAHAGEFTFGGKIFADVSQLQQNDYRTRTSSSAVDADLKRFYLEADYAFDAAWSVHLTTDVSWLRGQSDADLWVKHFYVQRKLPGSTVIRIGADDTPWLALNSKWYGYRYIDPIGTSLQKIDNGADYGVHVKSKLAPTVDVAVSVVTGGGYKRPTHGHRADVEALVAWQPTKQTVLALGGYDGQLAGDDDNPAKPLYHTARRIDLMAAYAGETWRFGARYAYASNWANLYTVRSERARNWSSWLSVQLAPQWSAFARFDRTSPSRLIDPARRVRYANAGVQWQPAKKLRLALVGKHITTQRNGNLLRSSNELGVWSEWAF